MVYGEIITNETSHTDACNPYRELLTSPLFSTSVCHSIGIAGTMLPLETVFTSFLHTHTILKATFFLLFFPGGRIPHAQSLLPMNSFALYFYIRKDGLEMVFSILPKRGLSCGYHLLTNIRGHRQMEGSRKGTSHPL